MHFMLIMEMLCVFHVNNRNALCAFHVYNEEALCAFHANNGDALCVFLANNGDQYLSALSLYLLVSSADYPLQTV